jgi:hypothetical protein
MIVIAFVMLFFGVLSVAAGWYAGGDLYSRRDMMMCASVFYGPFLVGGGFMVWRSVRMDRYLEELNEVADYIATYRKIDIPLLSRKMDIPDGQVWKLINDSLKYKLLEGHWTPDGRTFIVQMRPEDHQFVANCPYCKAQGINVQVIRGGSEKCPYCDSVIFFQENVVS